MATTTTNFGWDIPQSTDLVKDGATAIAALGQDIDTAMVDLKGGTTGQVLAKASGTDLDFSWVAQDDSNAIQNAIVDAKGDLIAATAADTPARLAVGTNGYVLTADSAEATGLKWAAAAGGGKVLQVVQGSYSTATTIASTTYTDTGLSLSITPTSATSKILVLVSQAYYFNKNAEDQGHQVRILRDGSAIFTTANSGAGYVTAGGAGYIENTGYTNLTYLDSPATTSATTYKTQGGCRSTANSGTVRYQYNSSPSTLTLLEIGA
jgi:hypothetical protein